MPAADHPILKKKFLLKRVGDEFLLPCTKPISSKSARALPNLPYVLCETVRFDEHSGRLSLEYPKSYENWNEEKYKISIQVNSDLILASNVTEFQILGALPTGTPPSQPFEWENLVRGSDWEPKPYHPNVRDLRSNPPPPTQTRINEKWWIPIQDVLFEDRKASFTRFVNPILASITFEIEHAAIRKEYDAIKDYFALILRNKNLEFQVKVEALGNNIQVKSAEFCNSELTNGALLEKVEDYVVRKTILNSEEEIAILEDKLKLPGSTEPKDVTWLLDRLEKLKKSKHYYHLRYLSSKHDTATFKLRVTGNPISFIFIINGPHAQFLVWETYDTKEATYLWRLTASGREGQKKEVMGLLDTIKWLRASNKMEYLRTKTRNFKKIDHDYSGENWGFEKWKATLLQLMTADGWDMK